MQTHMCGHKDQVHFHFEFISAQLMFLHFRLFRTSIVLLIIFCQKKYFVDAKYACGMQN